MPFCSGEHAASNFLLSCRLLLPVHVYELQLVRQGERLLAAMKHARYGDKKAFLGIGVCKIGCTVSEK